ncbi:hypothetical protein Tco_1246034 [Tanacetum coccineum]
MFNRNGSLTYSIFYIAHGLFSRKPAHALCSVLNPFLPGKRSCVGTRRQEDLELPVPEEDIPNLGGTFGAFIQWPNGAIARFSQSGEVSLSIPGPVGIPNTGTSSKLAKGGTRVEKRSVYNTPDHPIPKAGPSKTARIDPSINIGRGLYTFRINGQNYHRIRSLLPKEDTQPRNTQLWFFDTHNEIRNQLGTFMDQDNGDGVDGTIVGSLIKMLDQNSAIAKAFRMAKDWCHSHVSVNMDLRLLSERTSSRQYNASTVAERDIIVNKKDSGPKRISELHPSYMALQ